MSAAVKASGLGAAVLDRLVRERAGAFGSFQVVTLVLSASARARGRSLQAHRRDRRLVRESADAGLGPLNFGRSHHGRRMALPRRQRRGTDQRGRGLGSGIASAESIAFLRQIGPLSVRPGMATDWWRQIGCLQSIGTGGPSGRSPSACCGGQCGRSTGRAGRGLYCGAHGTSR